MSNPRDPSVDGRSRPGARTGTKPVRDPTESLAASERDEPWFDDDNMDPLSSAEAPLGTRDAPGRAPTRIESPAARNRTPAPPAPAQLAPDSGRKSRPSKPPARKHDGERAEERIGAVLGSYRLVELLGRGGMGFVYKAEHIKLGRTVALKLLRADYARRRDSVARFFQEARTVNRVRHRNIVDVTDFVELDDGTTFIIMELLEGQSLGKWARGGFSVPRALALLVQICDGLAAAHAVGVIHRDLKPDNVVVVPTGDGAELVKLLDFGVAKLLNRDDEDIGLETQAGSVIGTPAYMSPEQAGGTTVDVRSDIYSIGAIMYELFCGQPMFKGRSFGEFCRKHLSEIPVAPRATENGAAIDERLETVILRCIEKEPARRYQHIVELRDDLLHLLGGIDTQVGSVRSLGSDLGGTDSLRSADLLPASSRRSTPATPMPLPSAIAYAPPAAPRRWPWAIASVVVAGASAAAVAIALSGSQPATEPGGAEAAAAPKVEPAVTPLDVTAPRRIEGAPIIDVKLESTPSAEVFPVGAATKKCSTPCTLSIDPGDGGATTHRDFVLRAAGHHDETVTIDLARPEPLYAVTLSPRGERRRPDKPDRPDRRTERAAPPAADPTPVVEPAVEPPPPPPPVEKKPPKKDEKKDKKIDPTDTIDPFGS